MGDLYQGINAEGNIHLRRWEIEQGYTTPSSTVKITRKDATKIIRGSVATFFFACFVILVLGADRFLADIVQSMKDNQKFKISLTDFSSNITDSILHQLQQYDNNKGFSAAERTSTNTYLFITFLLLAALLSCAMEVFVSRGRAVMCSLFYPDRLLERADHLHYKLVTGRLMRRYNFPLLVRRQEDKEEKMSRFYKRLQKVLVMWRWCRSGATRCAACGYKINFNGSECGEFCSECELECDIYRKWFERDH